MHLYFNSHGYWVLDKDTHGDYVNALAAYSQHEMPPHQGWYEPNTYQKFTRGWYEPTNHALTLNKAANLTDDLRCPAGSMCCPFETDTCGWSMAVSGVQEFSVPNPAAQAACTRTIGRVCGELHTLPHPDRTNITVKCPSLPTPAWHSISTPCHDLPMLSDVCIRFGGKPAKLFDRLHNRTSKWISRAHYYYLQAATDNAAILARQVCKERSFLDLLCLEALDAKSRRLLSKEYDEACEFANVTARAALAGEQFEPQQVQPLTFKEYDPLVQFWKFWIENLNNAKISTGMIMMQANTVTKDEKTNELMATAYLKTLRDIQKQIEQRRKVAGMDIQRLSSVLHGQLSSQQAALRNAIRAANIKFEARVVLESLGLMMSVAVAALCAQPEVAIYAIKSAKEEALALAKKKALELAKEEALALCHDALQYVETRKASCGLSNDKAFLKQCHQMQSKVGVLEGKLKDMHKFVSTITGLKNLADTVIDSRQAVPFNDLPHVALLRASLNTIQIDAKATAFARSSSNANIKITTDIEQLIALIRTKLDVLCNWYKAKLTAQSFHTRRQMYEKQARLLSQFQPDSSNYASAWSQSKKLGIMDACHSLLRLLIHQTQSFQYIFLARIPGVNTADLLRSVQQAPLKASDFKKKLEVYSNKLQQAFFDEKKKLNNCANQCWSYLDIRLDELQGNQFAHSTASCQGPECTQGFTVSIDVPHDPGYTHVTFSNVQVYLLGLRAAPHTSVDIQFVKYGESILLGEKAQPWRFTHMDTNPKFHFSCECDTAASMCRLSFYYIYLTDCHLHVDDIDTCSPGNSMLSGGPGDNICRYVGTVACPSVSQFVL